MVVSERDSDKVPFTYWLVGGVLVVYVALCTGQRDNMSEADAWEHHRVLKTLSEQLWNPGNPTYATDTPSLRYSPYAVSWALFSRVSGLDPYDTLSAAAIVNMVLLLLGVAALLKSFGEARSATAVLVIMIGLYGGAPGHSNSYALSDLPWHQVNPSAFSFAITLFVWALFKRFERKGCRDFALPAMMVMSATALLDHAMTGTLTQVGLWILAMTAARTARLRLIKCAFCVGLAAFLMCLAWPWYSFIQAATIELPPGLVNRGLNRVMLSQYCAPAAACGMFALVFRERKAIRVFVLGGYLIYTIGWIVNFLPSWVPVVGALARVPLPGVIFFHLALGIFAYHAGLFRFGTWPHRLKSLLTGERAKVSQAAIEIFLAVMLAYFLIPQALDVLKKPYLARTYVAPIMGREDKQLRLKSRYDALLKPVGIRDVVLSDPITMWAVPSSNGRIVYAFHPEILVPDQPDRLRDVEAFFAEGTSSKERIRLLEKHNVRWIVLNKERIGRDAYASLFVEAAAIGQDNELTLMDASKWIRQKETQ